MTGDGALDGFSAATRAWFDGAFAEPTQAQAGAWRAIGRGEDTLVVAPTGSGKTLAAFLWAVDRLAAAPPPADPKRRTRVLYVSPLKALAVDIERNLRAPLTGIGHAAHRLGLAEPDIRVGGAHRRHRGRRAPEAGQQAAGHPDHHAGVAVPAAHLAGQGDPARGRDGHRRRGARGRRQQARRAPGAVAWSGSTPLRGDAPPAQRVGLSATVRPVEEVATFLGGSRPVTIVQPPSRKTIELQVVVPVEDMTELDTDAGPRRRGRRGGPGAPAVDLAARRGAGARPDRAAQVHDRVRELPPAGRAPVRPAERAGRRAGARAAEAGRARPAVADRARSRPGPTARCRRRPDAAGMARRGGRRRSPGPTTARCPGRSGPRSRRRSRPAGCPPWWPRPAWSSASTWARWTWWCRSRRRRRWPAGCSGSAGPGTTSATSPRHHLPQVPGRPGPGRRGGRADARRARSRS